MTYNSISNKVKKYFEFCTISGPTQLMPAPMRITHAQLLHCFTMSLQDSGKVYQHGMVDVRLFKHQLRRMKDNGGLEQINVGSLYSYSKILLISYQQFKQSVLQKPF